jgi:prolyl-tRNA synthetase
MIKIYQNLCEELLAVPVVVGIKSDIERFSGALTTYTIEAVMSNGWALQAGTSHFLGQNFAKAFDVKYTDRSGDRKFVWGTSWGVSTRLIGALIMTHSDSIGLTLPPKIAPTQIVIIPIPAKKKKGVANDDSDATNKKVTEFAEKLHSQLKKQFRTVLDDRDYMSPGSKYFEWEKKGCPLRIEIGPMDLAKGSVMVVPRVDPSKQSILVDDNLGNRLDDLLNSIQSKLFERAKAHLAAHTFSIDSYSEMVRRLEENKFGFYVVPWKANDSNEKAIKADCKATIRCYPLHLQNEVAGKRCFYSGEDATHMAIFARAF